MARAGPQKKYQKGSLPEVPLHILGVPAGSRKRLPKRPSNPCRNCMDSGIENEGLWESFQDCPGTAPGARPTPPAACPCPGGQVNLRIVLRFHHPDPAVQAALAPDAVHKGSPGTACEESTRTAVVVILDTGGHDFDAGGPERIPEGDVKSDPETTPKRTPKRHRNNTKNIRKSN